MTILVNCVIMIRCPIDLFSNYGCWWWRNTNAQRMKEIGTQGDQSDQTSLKYVPDQRGKYNIDDHVVTVTTN